jgi:hypothetical protein
VGLGHVQLVDADSLSRDKCTGCRVETLVLGVESRHLYWVSSRDTCNGSRVEILVLGVNFFWSTPTVVAVVVQLVAVADLVAL